MACLSSSAIAFANRRRWHGSSRTVVEEVEAAINPQTVFANGHVLLGVDGPLAGLGDDAVSLGINLGRHGVDVYCGAICGDEQRTTVSLEVAEAV